MAQYWFDASDSGFAALFTELQITGGKSAPTSSTVNGLPALNWGGNFNGAFFLLNSLPDLSPSATWEVLVRCCINDDDATNNIGPAGLLQGTNGDATGYLADRTYPETAWLRRYKNNSVSSVASSSSVTTVSSTMLEWIWMRLRHEPQGDGTVQLSVKLWKIEEAEPGAYSVTYNDSAANLIGTAGKPGIFVRDSTNAYLNAISVGTDGDPAPTSAPGPTNPRLSTALEQGSETASALSLSGTQPVALSSTLSQGSQVRVLANFMSTYILGLWNPGTESDGPLTWPFSYQPFLNQLVLQNGRFVGTTDLAGVPSYTQVDLTEIGTEPYTFYSVSGKINSRAATSATGAQFGLINPVSGAYALVQVWDKNWRLESSNGTDPAEVTSGILAESLNSFTITYNASVGRVILFGNESGLSNTIDIPGMSFTQASWQIENGGESVSFFEELHIGTQPTKYSPQLVYTRPSSSTLEQGSQLSSALQVGASRRLSATLEQGSELLARPGIGLAFSGLVEQGSEIISDAGQRLALSSTIEQGSSLSGAVSTSNSLALSAALEQTALLQARLPVGVPLGTSLSQDSALQARFVLGQPFGATALQATEVETRLRVGQGFVSLLEQSSEAFAGLSLGQRLSATLAQGSDLQSKAVVGNPLATVAAQASSVLGEMRLGAGMAASVYTDSVVSGGLRLGLPLYGTVDQAVSVSGAMATANALRLSATLSTPSTLTGALKRDSGVSLLTEITQQSVLETTLQGGTLAELLGEISTSGQIFVSLKNSVPVASILEQSSDTSVSLKVSIPLGAVEISTGSDLGSSLKSQLRLFSEDFQETSIGGATLNTDKRFSSLLLQQTEFNISQDALRFVGEAQSQVATEGLVSGYLRMGIRFQATLDASSDLDFGRFSVLQTLPEFLLQTRARISANLSKVGAGSTGYLTVSAIVFHNDYYSEVVFEGIPASEITLLPALRLDTVSIKPE